MANLRELNQSNPFWEWVADIEKQSRNTSRNGGEGSSQRTTPGNEEPAQEDKEFPDPEMPDWDEKMSTPLPQFDGPPPPPEFDDPPPPPGLDTLPNSPPLSNAHHQHPGGDRGRGFRRVGHGHHRGGHHGGGHGGNHGGGWGGFGGWGGPPMFQGPFGGRRGGACRRGRGPWGDMLGRGGFDFGRGGFDMEKLGQMLKNFGVDLGSQRSPEDDKDFSPAVDVFDTPQAHYVHLSLAGAKKQDLGVSWDAENFQVIVSGIIHRPGDEEFLKTLAVDEREIGLFERKIKLGTKTDPVSIDADTISAKMEDGVLMIKVPKHEEFIEIKKVDIQ